MPTSLATRVTSEENEFSWSTIRLSVFLSSSFSPFTSTVIFLDRSPLATAVITSAMLRIWPVSRPAIVFTLSVRSFHTPTTLGTCAWPPRRPSVPTSCESREISLENRLSCATSVLITVPTRNGSPRSGRPSTSSTTLCERSPLAIEPITRATSVTG